jgi:hypothetical protein
MRVQGVLEGFAVIGLVIALGFALARIGVVGAESLKTLTRLVFFVATPALLFDLLSGADVRVIFSTNLAVAALSAMATATGYLVLAKAIWRRSAPDTVIGMLSSAYVNAGNLGLPIAVYVLGDGSYIAPVLLLQLIVFTPLAFAMLDTFATGGPPAPLRLISQPFRNPITVGSMLGLLAAVTGWTVPTVLDDAVSLVGGIAVPGALLAYGISLRVGPRPMAGGSAAELSVVAALKLVVQPALAYALGRFAFGLDGTPLLAVTVVAALPSAQNIFVYALRYDRAVILARDSIFVTTILAVPALLVIAALLA